MRLALAFPIALAALPAWSEITSETITFTSEGETVVGTLTRPEGDPSAVVLLFHGFTGTRDELPIPGTDEGVFSRTARILAEQGLSSLRIDFRGSGDSDGAFADTTFEGQIADGIAALAWLEADDRVNGDDITLIGWSQGGLVAAVVAGRTGIPDATALWAAVATPTETFTGILGAEAMAAGATTGDTPYVITLPWGAEIPLKQPFFDGMSIDPLTEIAAYTRPLFVAQGSLDTTVAPVSAELYIAAHDGPEELWTAEMDHVFNAFTETAALDAMVNATIRFFAENTSM